MGFVEKTTCNLMSINPGEWEELLVTSKSDKLEKGRGIYEAVYYGKKNGNGMMYYTVVNIRRVTPEEANDFNKVRIKIFPLFLKVNILTL